MNPLGGSELLYNNLLRYLGQDWQQTVNLVLSRCDKNIIDTGRKNVVWQHVMPNQGVVQGLNDPDFIKSIDHYVYVSNWQLDKFKQQFDISESNNHVIYNAIEPIELRDKPKEKIRLIYTSMPFRGLDVLLDVFDLLNRDDIELVVYSSNIIYGKGYSDAVGRTYDALFERCRRTSGVIYRGYAMNRAIRSALQSSHILAYPSTFEETSCLAAIEAGAAGCRIVTTDLGALHETCGEYADYVPFTFDRRELVESYAKKLNSVIDLCQQNQYNLIEQSVWFNQRYSWVNRAVQWREFFNKIC